MKNMKEQKTYNDATKVMDGARTLKDHITDLEEFVDKPPTAPQLISYI